VCFLPCFSFGRTFDFLALQTEFKFVLNFEKKESKFEFEGPSHVCHVPNISNSLIINTTVVYMLRRVQYSFFRALRTTTNISRVSAPVSSTYFRRFCSSNTTTFTSTTTATVTVTAAAATAHSHSRQEQEHISMATPEELAGWQSNWKKAHEEDTKLGWQFEQNEDVKGYEDSYQFIKKHGDLDGSESFFVPLCGDDPATSFASQHGHYVYGLEFATHPLETQRNERFKGVTFTESQDSKVNGGLKTFTSDKATFYNGDFFQFEPSKQVDVWYDRAAFIAVKPNNRASYMDIAVKTMKPGSLFFLSCVSYPDGAKDRPPYAVDDADIAEFFTPHGLKLIKQDRDYMAPPSPQTFRLDRYLFRKNQSDAVTETE
jgi:Thiopurine S-methyltransferase (TPMT)